MSLCKDCRTRTNECDRCGEPIKKNTIKGELSINYDVIELDGNLLAEKLRHYIGKEVIITIKCV